MSILISEPTHAPVSPGFTKWHNCEIRLLMAYGDELMLTAINEDGQEIGIHITQESFSRLLSVLRDTRNA